ncbi:hypothetical protein KJ780_04415 [Candidatus Micrarchaeota archaeon]|nr:hypothetical protein [Candidatus Micrarchaeota archaeon]
MNKQKRTELVKSGAKGGIKKDPLVDRSNISVIVVSSKHPRSEIPSNGPLFVNMLKRFGFEVTEKLNGNKKAVIFCDRPTAEELIRKGIDASRICATTGDAAYSGSVKLAEQGVTLIQAPVSGDALKKTIEEVAARIMA